MTAWPLFFYISNDNGWILSQVPRDNTSHVFQDLGNAFACMSGPQND